MSLFCPLLVGVCVYQTCDVLVAFAFSPNETGPLQLRMERLRDESFRSSEAVNIIVAEHLGISPEEASRLVELGRGAEAFRRPGHRGWGVYFRFGSSFFWWGRRKENEYLILYRRSER